MLEPNRSTIANPSLSSLENVMSALMIKDLSVTEQLDSKAMKSVRGGYVFAPFPSLSFKFDNSKTVDAQQLVNQTNEIDNVSDNNNAFAEHLPTTIKTNVKGNNSISL
jgi:hypothetical protein